MSIIETKIVSGVATATDLVPTADRSQAARRVDAVYVSNSSGTETVAFHVLGDNETVATTNQLWPTFSVKSNSSDILCDDGFANGLILKDIGLSSSQRLVAVPSATTVTVTATVSELGTGF